MKCDSGKEQGVMTPVAERFQAWMNATKSAAIRLCRVGELYAGKNGCRRFARECAPAILDFGDYGLRHIGDTYGAICVRSYDLRPPVNAALWLKWMREKIDEIREEPKPITIRRMEQ